MLSDILDGFLLGDGHLQVGPSSGSNARIKFSSSKRDFTTYVISTFSSYGISFGPVFDRVCQFAGPDRYHRPGGYQSWNVSSRCHSLLTRHYLRWYPDRHKSIPADVVISSSSLLWWYLGDGFIRDVYPILVSGHPLSQLGGIFEQLCSIFPDVSLRPVPGRKLYEFRFGSKSKDDLFSYIGPCPVPSYSYKFPPFIDRLGPKVCRCGRQFVATYPRKLCLACKPPDSLQFESVRILKHAGESVPDIARQLCLPYKRISFLFANA